MTAYEEKRTCDRRELAQYLDYLARAVGEGTLKVGTAELALPEKAELELEWKDNELEIEIKWRSDE
ncbi:MAG: amphi-Trp domain-containing protein, partial [Firmicutes bacterium]|nr:amphi-Trp domain-containing protein [Bacillota bacterium]